MYSEYISNQAKELKYAGYSLVEEAEDEHLYHATYRTHMTSISKHGLSSNSKHKNWNDSKPGRVYFAKDPHEALSHAESAEDAPERHYNSGIVVYKVKKKHLDQSKLHKDTNNRDADTVEYHGDVKPEHVEIHSQHDT